MSVVLCDSRELELFVEAPAMATRTAKRVYLSCVIIILYNIAFFLMCHHYLVPQRYDLNITELPGGPASIPDDFIGVGIDASEFQQENYVNFSSPKLQELTAALAPARLRLGGTQSERLVFSRDMTAATCDACRRRHSNFACGVIRDLCRRKVLPFFLLTVERWMSMNEFCQATGLKLMFSLNAMLRKSDNTWDDRNTRDLLAITKQNNYSVDFQLGNEPNSFPHNFNVTVPPKTMAEDFGRVREVLDEYGFKESLLVGPDTTRPQPRRPECLKYMKEFLTNGSQHINARSWHQYYLNSRTATLDDFWSTATADLLKEQIRIMTENTSEYENIPMWLTETSSAYGGGTPGISDSYGASALWIDKLGLASKSNITMVFRQSLIGGNYSLLDKEYNPLPDYWVTLLFKKVVGNKVLNVDCHCPSESRLYAHCAKSGYANETGAITIYGVNMQHSLVKIELNELGEQELMVDEYVISPPSSKRLTKRVTINGFHLNTEKDLKPRMLSHVKMLQIPPYSIVFWVLKNPAVDLCN